MIENLRRLADTYYLNENKVQLTEESALNLTIGLTVGVFVAMAFELSSPEVCFLVALSVLMLSEVLSMNDVLAGFSNDGLITIGSLFLVVGAMEKSHMIDYGSRLAFGFKSSTNWGIFRFLTSSFIISAFFNNIPQVAIMVPIVKDWAKLRKISSSQLLIPLSYSVLAGGMLATIGTSTNLVIQGLLSADKKKRQVFGFWDPAAVGLPAGLIVILYMMIAAPYLLPHHKDKEDDVFLRAQNQIAELTIESNSSFIGVTIGDVVGRLGVNYESVLRLSRTESKDPGAYAELTGKAHQIVPSSSSDNIELGAIKKQPRKNAYDYEIVTDSDAKDTSHIKPDASNKNILRVMNDAVYQPFTEKYRKWKLKFESKYPEIFRVPENVGVHSFYGPSQSSITEKMDLPDPSLEIKAGDIITFANSANVIEKLGKAMPWERQGLTLFGGISADDLLIFGEKIVEATISPSSNFIGLNFGVAANVIYRKYSSAAVSYRSESDVINDRAKLLKRPASTESTLEVGDTLILVTSRENLMKLSLSRDFSGVHQIATTPLPATYWSFYPILVFMTIVSLVAANQVEMTTAALSMASLFFIGGWIVPGEIEKFVDVRLLMLMGCSLSFAKAMTTTGLANKIADAIAGGGVSANNSLYLIYLATLLITELISNNAAAAMMYPIAVALADNLGVSYKPFAMVVMQAASMAFMCPIGYPTHVMVWGPGQYNFFDFCKFGLIPNIIWWVLSCLISAAVWPLDA